MVANLERRKIKLIEQIIKLDSEKAISKLEVEVEGLNNDLFWEAVKPIRREVSIEQMIHEQNYKPLNKEEFYDEVAKIDITEPLEDLLAMLRP